MLFVNDFDGINGGSDEGTPPLLRDQDEPVAGHAFALAPVTEDSHTNNNEKKIESKKVQVDRHREGNREVNRESWQHHRSRYRSHQSRHSV